jgi:hypothetical protein
MAGILSTEYFGGSAAAILVNRHTRIYYQANDGAIHESIGIHSVVLGGRYSDYVVVPAEDVRINSPIAATTWGPNPDDQAVSHLPSHHQTDVGRLNPAFMTDPPLLHRSQEPSS